MLRMRVELVDRSANVTAAVESQRQRIGDIMGRWIVEEIRHSIQQKDSNDNPYLQHQLRFGGVSGPWVQTDNNLIANDPLERLAFNVLKFFASEHRTYDSRGDLAERRRRQLKQARFNAKFGFDDRHYSESDPLGLLKEQSEKQKKSAPGSPPFTRGLPGKNLPDAIQYEVTAEGDVIVYVDNTVGPTGQLMEAGGERGGAVYERRPFLRPALEKAAYPFVEEWKGAIGV